MAKNAERRSQFAGLTDKIQDTIKNTPTQTPTTKPTRMLPQKEFKSKRIQLLMKPSVVGRLDAYAKSIGSNRNDILNKIVEEFLCDDEYRFKFEEKFLVEEGTHE